MSVTIADMQSVATAGWWITSGGSPPAEPTLSVSNDGDGDAITAAVDGDAGVTNRLFYRKTADASWTVGNTRAGDGDIAQAGLDAETWYDFVVVSDDGGYYSVPSKPASVYVTAGGGTDGTGMMGLALENLRELLAASSNFQDWIGAEGTEDERIAAAKLRIYRVAKETPTRPFAVVRFAIPGEWESEAIAGGAKGHYIDRGTLELFFEADVASAQQDETKFDEAEILFLNKTDSIISDMMDLAGSGAYLHVRSFAVSYGPVRSAKGQGEFYQIGYRIEYGLTSTIG